MAAIGSMHEPLDDFVESMKASGNLSAETFEKYKNFEGPAAEKEQFFLDLLAQVPDGGKEVAEAYSALKAKDLYTLCTSPGPRMRSEALTVYGCGELCLELDCFYGLKEAHNIQDFITYLLQTGLYTGLMDPDPEKADKAVSDLAFYWLDDGHSCFTGHSWMTAADPERTLGVTNFVKSVRDPDHEQARAMFPAASQSYYETGDTAFVTFDDFDIAMGPAGIADYNALAEADELPKDTLGIIIDAHRRITRENSPVRNVVLDLSCNGGGAAPAAVYTLCWFLGSASLSIQDTFTQGQSTSTYMADVNLDGAFDEKDTLAGRGLNLFCLTSPRSFSCGNLVPWAFKADGRVTLLGKVTGGGSCIVRPITTAWGTSFQISGTERISFVKNGSYYDVDQGVEPDYIIRDYRHFYDREALADFINGLF